jgi:hypothetical protein
MDIWYTYFTAIWYIILAFGVFYCYSVYFSPFWYIVPRKMWQPLSLLRVLTRRAALAAKASARR